MTHEEIQQKITTYKEQKRFYENKRDTINRDIYMLEAQQKQLESEMFQVFGTTDINEIMRQAQEVSLKIQQGEQALGQIGNI
jgi:hypothetical protein